jgi:PEP-CTERM motif
MLTKCLPLLGALAVASPAFAISVNMDGFTLGAADVVMTGTEGVSPSYSGQAGEFSGNFEGALSGAQNLRSAVLDAAPTSFLAWCAELTQSFSFGVSYEYSQVSGIAYFGTQKATDLSRLFTAAQGFVVDSLTSAALQAGIWEIIYETDPSFSLTGGKFKGAPETPAGQPAFGIVNGFLLNLGSYQASARIDVLSNEAQQDFLVATPVPEPETWLLFGIGLGSIGLMRRQRRS